MIRNQWYIILESNEVKPGKLVGTTRMGEKLVLWRDQDGKVSCMKDQCPHRGVALSCGKLIVGQVQCPFHGFLFDSQGNCTLIPANGKIAAVPKAFQAATYPTHEEHGFIWIWWGEPHEKLPPVYFFESISPEMSYATIRDHWAIHYSRAIENQLDVVHLPFVHHNTIGRGDHTVVDGPLVQWECETPEINLLNLWVFNRVDDGPPPLKASQLTQQPARVPSLQFCFPNLWQNWISPDLRVLVAFAPIDEENTMMYLRWYQSFLRAPVLKQIVNWLGSLGNLIIERQDKRVVETQLPKRSGLHIGETLIPGDGPVIVYRRKREELIQQNCK
jgi:phenylpropionate dioxygenase-like ring-hydroxylating dioxygenase large terminal subunit